MKEVKEYIQHVYTEFDGLFSINDLQYFLEIGYQRACDILQGLENQGICKKTSRGRYAILSLDKALIIISEVGD